MLRGSRAIGYCRGGKQGNQRTVIEMSPAEDGFGHSTLFSFARPLQQRATPTAVSASARSYIARERTHLRDLKCDRASDQGVDWRTHEPITLRPMNAQSGNNVPKPAAASLRSSQVPYFPTHGGGRGNVVARLQIERRLRQPVQGDRFAPGVGLVETATFRGVWPISGKRFCPRIKVL